MSKNTRPAQLHDFVGNPIQIGDFIAYGKSLGRCAGVNIGVVKRVYEVENFYGKWEPRISIISNQDSWKKFPERIPTAVDYSGKPVTKGSSLSFLDRCVVIKDIGNSPMALEMHRISQEILAANP